MSEPWKTRKVAVPDDLGKRPQDRVHEFLTKTFNVHFVQIDYRYARPLEAVREKLIPLTVRIDPDKYKEFCETFSKTYRALIVDKEVPDSVKKVVNSLVNETNKFFSETLNLGICVEELKYHKLVVKVTRLGKPLEGVRVIVESEGKTVNAKETDKSGTVEFEVPAGKYLVYVYKSVGETEEGAVEYLYDEKTVEIDKDVEIEMKLDQKPRALHEIRRTYEGRPFIREIEGESK